LWHLGNSPARTTRSLRNSFRRRLASTLPLPEATGGWAMPNSKLR
jgi:hypothetical protein